MRHQPPNFSDFFKSVSLLWIHSGASLRLFNLYVSMEFIRVQFVYVWGTGRELCWNQASYICTLTLDALFHGEALDWGMSTIVDWDQCQTSVSFCQTHLRLKSYVTSAVLSLFWEYSTLRNATNAIIFILIFMYMTFNRLFIIRKFGSIIRSQRTRLIIFFIGTEKWAHWTEKFSIRNQICLRNSFGCVRFWLYTFTCLILVQAGWLQFLQASINA